METSADTEPKLINLPVDRILVALFLSLVFILAGPMVTLVYENLVLFLAILLTMMILCATFDNHLVDTLLIGLILFSLLITKLSTNTEDAYVVLRVMSISSLLLLSFTLLIGPWAKFNRKLAKLIRHRRHIGVAALLTALFHYRLITFANNIGPESILSIPHYFMGSLVIYILLLLGITSWDYFQRHGAKKWWNIIHLLSLLPVLVGFGYLIQNDSPLLENWHIAYFICLILIWLAIIPAGIPRLLFGKVNHWRHFHLLGYLAFITLYLHAWEAAIDGLNIYIQVIYWAIFSLVVGSHIAGRIIVINKKIKRKSNHANQTQ